MLIGQSGAWQHRRSFLTRFLILPRSQAARQALGRVVDQAPTARRLHVGQEQADAELKPTRRRALRPARILFLALLVLTSSSAWYAFVPSAPTGAVAPSEAVAPSAAVAQFGVVASLPAPPVAAARIGLLTLLDGIRRPRGLERENSSCDGSVSCRWRWTALSCGPHGQCGWRLAWPLGSHWCYEKRSGDGQGHSR
jgi:hypothetical protein